MNSYKVKHAERKARKLNKMLADIEKAEQILLVKRNKGLARNLKRYLKCKQNLIELDINSIK